MRNGLVRTSILFSFFVCLLFANASFITTEIVEHPVKKESHKHSVFSIFKNKITSISFDRSVQEELFNVSEVKLKKGRTQRGKWKSAFPDFGSDDLFRELRAGFLKPLYKRDFLGIAKQFFGKLHYCEEILSSRCHPPTK